MNKGEIWIVAFPFFGGHEQAKTRPSIVLSDTNPLVAIVIPLTTNLQTLRFKNTLLINPSEDNGLKNESVILVFQITTVDKEKFLNKIGMIGPETLKKLDNVIKSMLKL